MGLVTYWPQYGCCLRKMPAFNTATIYPLLFKFRLIYRALTLYIFKIIITQNGSVSITAQIVYGDYGITRRP